MCPTAWCSTDEVTIRWPRALPAQAAPLSARLFASVPPDVKTISRGSALSRAARRSWASSRPARAARPNACADGVAERLGQERQHRVEDLAAQRRRRGVVEVDRHGLDRTPGARRSPRRSGRARPPTLRPDAATRRPPIGRPAAARRHRRGQTEPRRARPRRTATTAGMTELIIRRSSPLARLRRVQSSPIARPGPGEGFDVYGLFGRPRRHRVARSASRSRTSRPSASAPRRRLSSSCADAQRGRSALVGRVPALGRPSQVVLAAALAPAVVQREHPLAEPDRLRGDLDQLVARR